MASSAYSQKSRSSISRHIRKHRKEGMPQDQAVAAAMSEQRRKGRKVPARKGKAAKKGSAKKRGGSTKSKKAKAGRKGGKATARKSR